MGSGQPLPNQVWLVPHVEGTPRWYLSSKTPLAAANGRTIGIAGAMYPIETPEEQASYFHELLPAVRFMDANDTTTVSMQTVAGLAGLSATQFNVRFRAILRMSPTQYVLSRRIQEARNLLTGTSLSISEIGLAVGFFDQSHFTKRFRKFTGLTPLQYRKRFHALTKSNRTFTPSGVRRSGSMVPNEPLATLKTIRTTTKCAPCTRLNRYDGERTPTRNLIYDE